jgi:mannose-1-phosphate guanylyltransferase
MAGGSGERFWPLSRKQHPKQLLTLFSDQTMLAEAVERIAHVIPKEQIFIITGELLKDAIIQAVPDIPQENVIAEPSKRNTAPCLALGYAIIRSRFNLPASELTIGVFTADHFIRPADIFAADIRKALDHASKHADIVTFGIPPSRPEIGYGYIESGDALSDGEIKSVKSFREKPNLDNALEYISQGGFYWNSGMFFYRLDTFAAAMKIAMPSSFDAMEILHELCAKGNVISSAESIEAFEGLEATSIDYGIMERVKNVVVLPASFTWDDVGSWDALSRLGDTDASGNIISGNSIVINAKDSIIWNEHPNIMLTAHSIDGMTIIATSDAIMVCPTDKAQDVKSIVTELRNQDKEQLL